MNSPEYSVVSVSVVIPAFNCAPTLTRAIRSAICQSQPPYEIIVIDDGSTDATPQIVEGIAKEARNIKLLRLPRRGGAAAARNAGIALATGDAVAFLDADDEWLPSKLEIQTRLLTSSDKVVFVGCASTLFGWDGSSADTFGGHPVTTGPDCWRALMAFNYVCTPAVLVWRHHLVAAGSFDETLEVAEDQDLWIRLALRGDFEYAPQNLVKVYQRPDSLSSKTPMDAITYTLPMVERHIAALRPRLSDAEIRHIRGERMSVVGRNVYAAGHVGSGIRLLGRAIILGSRRGSNLYFIVAASPPARWLKSQLGLG